MKTCTKCKLELPEECFHKRIASKDTLRSHCKSCNSIESKSQITLEVKADNIVKQEKNKTKWNATDPHNNQVLRQCSKCKQFLPCIDFFINRHRSDGLRLRCKQCVRSYSIKYYKENTARIMFNSAKARAKAYNYEFNITLEDIVIPKICPVLKIPIEDGSGTGHGPNMSSATLDRIDNNKGYTKGNVRVISHRANTLKSDATLEELQLIVNDFLKNHPN